ncbi:MAG: DUF2232 domain-containing protein [Clostridia bacterium]|nr:DUF2232 domain-containing protein [Clostridia bacterium]
MSGTYSQDPSVDEIRNTDELFPVRKIIIFAFLTVLSGAYLPAGILALGLEKVPAYITLPAFLLLGAGIAFMFLIVKRFFMSVCSAILLFFMYSYTQSPIIPAIAVSAVIIFALGGFLSSMCNKKTYVLLALIPIFSYLGAYALTGNWLLSLIAIAPFPSIVAQGVLQKKNSERKTIILVSSALLIAMLSCIGVLALYLTGRLHISFITSSMANAQHALAEYMKGLSFEMKGEMIPAFEAEYVNAFVSQAFNLLPGFAVVTVFTLIYFSHSIQLETYKSADFDLMVTQKTSRISMSVYAAGLFILAFILSLSTDTAGNPDILSVVAGNLRLMLTPGLLIVGLGSLSAILRKLRGLGFFVLLFLFVAIFTLSDYIVLILAAIGAVYIIVTAIDEWAQKHYSKKNF